MLTRFFILRMCRSWLIAVALMLLAAQLAFAADERALNILSASTTPLGKHLAVLVESGQKLSLQQALEAVRQGQFKNATSDVIGFGIGHCPIWVHLQIDNNTDQPVTRYLVVQPTWVDQIDIHVVHPKQGMTSWQTGDAIVGAPYLDESLGYLIEHSFAPGRSELLIRMETPDPLLIDLRLLSKEDVAKAAVTERYSYGFLYGFFCSLILYNLVIYLILKRGHGLFYSVYLLTCAAMNFTYTGRGLAWLWPQYPDFQRYVILALMVLTVTTGLRFASEFLEFGLTSPQLERALRWFRRLAVAVMAGAIIMNFQELAVWIAFLSMVIFVFS